jgi:hypothetical protein
MKKTITLFIALFITVSTFGQAPQKMSYQAVIRNSSNALLVSLPVGMQISVLQGSVSGTAVYVETQTATTNANGLVSIAIGSGTAVTGTFGGIDWTNGPYFIKTETDPTGGTNYTITGTSELMSVPYALFSANEKVGGFTHYVGEAFGGGIIYYVYKGFDGLEHGLILSTAGSGYGYAQWQSTASWVHADTSHDGALNTSKMTNSPAALYVTSLGAGWYLPSIDELGLLFASRFRVEKALYNGGYQRLSYGVSYWSSSEWNTDSAVFMNFSTGFFSTNLKTNQSYIRAIKAF